MQSKTWGRAFVALVVTVLLFAVVGERGRTAEEHDVNTQGKDDVVKISMQDIKFVPEKAKVNVGQTVRWTNDGCANHTATSTDMDKDKKRFFDTKVIESGQSKDIVFDEALFAKMGGMPGGQIDVPYFCTIHGKKMAGTITLVSPPKVKESKN